MINKPEKYLIIAGNKQLSLSYIVWCEERIADLESIFKEVPEDAKALRKANNELIEDLNDLSFANMNLKQRIAEHENTIKWLNVDLFKATFPAPPKEQLIEKIRDNAGKFVSDAAMNAFIEELDI